MDGLEVGPLGSRGGGVVHGGRGPRRRSARGEAMGEGGSGSRPRRGVGRGVGRMPGEKGLLVGRSLITLKE